MSDLLGNHIVGFPMRRLISFWGFISQSTVSSHVRTELTLRGICIDLTVLQVNNMFISRQSYRDVFFSGTQPEAVGF